MAYDTAVLAGSPAVYLKLDEITGATVASDSSGNLNHGTYTGSVIHGMFGPVDDLGGSWGFHNSAGHVDLGSGILTGGAAAFTIEAWAAIENVAYTEAAVGNNPVVTVGAGAGSGELRIDFFSDRVVYRAGGVQYPYVVSSLAGCDNWHHLAMTYDGTTLRTFFDGVIRHEVVVALSVNTTTIDVGSSGVIYHDYLAISEFAAFNSRIADATLAARIGFANANTTEGCGFRSFDTSVGDVIVTVADANYSAESPFNGSGFYAEAYGLYQSSQQIFSTSVTVGNAGWGSIAEGADIYAEFVLVNAQGSDLTNGEPGVGIASYGDARVSTTDYRPGKSGASDIGYYTDGNVYKGGSVVATYATYGVDDVIGVVVDNVAKEVKFYKNGALQGTVAFTTVAPYLSVGGQTRTGAGAYTTWRVFAMAKHYYATPVTLSNEKLMYVETPISVATYEVSGTVTENGTAVARTVRAHKEADGTVAGQTVSSASTGAYTINLGTYNGDVYVVSMNDSPFEPAIHRPVTPGAV